MEGGDLIPLLRKLQSIGDPTDAERRALADLHMTIKVLHARKDIVREGERPSDVIASYGFHRCTIYWWLKRPEGGATA